MATAKTMEKPADKASTAAVLPVAAIMRDAKDSSTLLEMYFELRDSHREAWTTMRDIVPQLPFGEILWPFCIGWTVRHNGPEGPWIGNVEMRDTFQNGDSIVHFAEIGDDLVYVANDKATLLKFLDETDTPRHSVIIRTNHAVR